MTATVSQKLDWDTNFFGFEVVRINAPCLTQDELSTTLLELKHEGVSLVYWPAKHPCDPAIIQSLGGMLVDNRVTLTTNLEHFTDKGEVSSAIKAEPYNKDMAIRELEDLAVQCGQYSRFCIDPNIPRDRFIALYKIWINRALQKELSDEVLVIQTAGKVTGIITLGNNGECGNIGLLGVDRNHRGKKLGEKLLQAAQVWFLQNGYSTAQVVTQYANKPACKLYKKCGYVIETVEPYYHFWPQSKAAQSTLLSIS